MEPTDQIDVYVVYILSVFHIFAPEILLACMSQKSSIER